LGLASRRIVHVRERFAPSPTEALQIAQAGQGAAQVRAAGARLGDAAAVTTSAASAAAATTAAAAASGTGRVDWRNCRRERMSRQRSQPSESSSSTG